ncbi:MAG: hypothetical protein MI723_04920, partial [Caulobacterales bacterium]|nr:hypothetical protein [Caulobacterales bacterium]
CVKEGEGNSGFFGGASPDDASGVLRYVQVKYAGFRITTDNELNGIAFQGVGRGVSDEAAAVLGAGQQPFEFIQVHNNDDDGVEFFGGTANIRNVVLTGNGDDSLDWTDGWNGNLQYVLIDQGNGEADNGFEADNRSNDFPVTPISRPTISNVTFIGDETLASGRALRLRAGTAGLIANSIFVKPGAGCLYVDAEQGNGGVDGDGNPIPALNLVDSDDLNLESVLFDCATNTDGDSGEDPSDGAAAQALFDGPSSFFVEVLFQEDDGDVVVGRGGVEANGAGDAIPSNFTFPFTLEQYTGSVFETDADPDTAPPGGGVVTGSPTTLTVTASTLTQDYFPGPSEFAVPAVNLTITGNAVDNADGGEPGGTGVSAAFVAASGGDGSGGQGFDPTFFDAANYIGAFGPEDSPESNWASGWTFGVFEDDAAPTGCPSGTIATEDNIDDADGVSKPVCRLQGTLTSDVTLTNDNVYQINGVVSVGQDNAPTTAGGAGESAAQAVLTIEAGTTLFGVNGPDLLVVRRGSQIIADGTPTAPIVFTSDEDLSGANDLTPTARGQFGGLVINGKAPINDCDGAFATPDQGGTVNCVKSGEGNSGFFGGADADDSSGVLRYVQVRYAGFRFTPQNELNGIAFQGVGRGVSDEAAAVLADGEQPFEFIQVHNN